ncbi:HAMP domain-containing sensor histidine kinase [Nocardioides sp. KR10-350]|uniref:sensor histidine kinase n=1 Tax=Nocardioides cheoyonin TaxID=3156615 RepID=UPI0032B5830C
MKLFATLTSRLVVTAVALVLLVCVLIGTITAVAMHRSLMARLDSDVHDLAQTGPPGRLDTRNLPPKSLLVFLYADGTVRGGVIGAEPGQVDNVSDSGMQAVADVRPDARAHTLDVAGYGDYRVISEVAHVEQTGETVTVVRGLPTSDVEATIHNLVWWEAALTFLGVLAAAGAGTYVVRRQLRPLREVAATAHTVAALPMASGEVEVSERVPERLTDAGTEVGQVGAALNTLLDHVETSLAERHRSEQQVRQFVADASHELRTPLTTIRGYTELAQQRPAAVATALAKVEEESGRMTAMVEDLLLLARLDQGRPLERKPVDLTRLLLEAVDDARVVAPDHQWHLALPAGADPEEDAAVVVDGDEQRLHQVITNLLTNARVYTPPGTTVTVTLRPDGFTVHDDGPGFPPELVPHAFERFTRGDAARNRTGGAGLGLSLVHAIVTSHGGSVTLSSRPGDTTIGVRLPRG